MNLITFGSDSFIGLSNPSVTLKYATKWGGFFRVPMSWVMTIAEMESDHNPQKINMLRAEKGGAWGLMQQMADEAPYKIRVIKRVYGKRSSEIAKTLKKWKGNPRDLLDPDLNMLIAIWQLDRLRRIFFDHFPIVVAAYHQGENAVKERLANRLPAVSKELQPKGFAYVKEAIEKKSLYETPVLALR